jgi:beta-alanine degradation protein BauB
MRTRTKTLLAACLFLGLSLPLATTHSEQSTAAGQTQRFPQFENEDVRVWKSVILPGAPLPMHRHDHPRVIIALSGGTMKIVDQTGAAETHVWETGKAYWLPANPPNTLHQDVNAGDKPIEVMVVELTHEK